MDDNKRSSFHTRVETKEVHIRQYFTLALYSCIILEEASISKFRPKISYIEIIDKNDDKKIKKIKMYRE